MSSEQEDNIKLTGVYKEKKPSKVKSFLFVLLLVFLIVVTIVLAGFVGTEFVTLYVFILIFGFPLLIIYKESIVGILPDKISKFFLGDLQSISDETEKQIGRATEVIVPASKKEYQTLFLGLMSLGASLYLMIMKNEHLSGIFMSLFFGVLSHIILGDLF